MYKFLEIGCKLKWKKMIPQVPSTPVLCTIIYPQHHLPKPIQHLPNKIQYTLRTFQWKVEPHYYQAIWSVICSICLLPGAVRLQNHSTIPTQPLLPFTVMSQSTVPTRRNYNSPHFRFVDLSDHISNMNEIDTYKKRRRQNTHQNTTKTSSFSHSPSSLCLLYCAVDRALMQIIYRRTETSTSG